MKRRLKDDFILDEGSDEEFSHSDDDGLSQLATGLKKKSKVKAVMSDGDESAEETIDEKRIRLARQYLDKVGAEAEELSSAGEEEDSVEYTDDVVGKELRKQALRLAGREPRRSIVQKYDYSTFETEVPSTRILRAHRLPPTCLALSEDNTIAFTGSKDRSIVKYDIETGAKSVFNAGRNSSKKGKQTGHGDEVLGVCLSSDNVYLASVGRDKHVRVWDTRSRDEIYRFREHRDTVSCCAFRKDSLSLYTGSFDRTINIYNIEQGTFVETLYGHQAPINSLTALYQERVISGADDHSVRIWKIPQESQLLFRGDSSIRSVDTVSAFSADHVVSGAQDGSLSLWSSQKKRPMHTIKNAHDGKWINSTAALYASDLAVSGSSDGFVRGWQADINTNKMTSIFNIPVVGHVNALDIGKKGRFVVAAVGQEHKFGRWDRIQPARCGLHIIPLDSAMIEDFDHDLEDDSQRGADESSDEEEDKEQFIMG